MTYVSSQNGENEEETMDAASETFNVWSSPSSSVASFNPFVYQGSVGPINTKNIISLRSTRMQQITNDLLNAYPDRNQILQILQSHQEFLLEPLEDDMAVQDVDSIYRNCANRTERYRQFAQSMTDRLSKVRDPAVRQVLTALNDFILSHEHIESPPPPY